jgi:hypothetical protein
LQHEDEASFATRQEILVHCNKTFIDQKCVTQDSFLSGGFVTARCGGIADPFLPTRASITPIA